MIAGFTSSIEETSATSIGLLHYQRCIQMASSRRLVIYKLLNLSINSSQKPVRGGDSVSITLILKPGVDVHKQDTDPIPNPRRRTVEIDKTRKRM